MRRGRVSIPLFWSTEMKHFHNEPTQEQDEGQADNFEAQAELDQRG
jgi:hypothetical protein